jgi:hypothetical protein
MSDQPPERSNLPLVRSMHCLIHTLRSSLRPYMAGKMRTAALIATQSVLRSPGCGTCGDACVTPPQQFHCSIGSPPPSQRPPLHMGWG